MHRQAQHIKDRLDKGLQHSDARRDLTVARCDKLRMAHGKLLREVIDPGKRAFTCAYIEGWQDDLQRLEEETNKFVADTRGAT
jgi:hypothetical protein